MRNNPLSASRDRPSRQRRPRKLILPAAFSLLLLLASGCRPSLMQMTQTAVAANPPTPAGTLDPAQAPERGRIVFNGAGQCATCHSVDGSDRPTGPGMLGIASHVAERHPDRELIEFLHESIVHTDAVIAEGYAPGVMPNNYEEILTAQQIDDLIAYLVSLE